MARIFPRATRRPAGRRRALVATLVALVSVLAASPALADLGDKREDLESKIDEAHEHLDHSSAELEEATEALLAAQADLADAQAHLAKTRGQLAAARALDREMQAQLDAAIARLARARRDLAAGRADLAEQEAQVRQVVVTNYQQGDPALLGLSMVLTTQDPAQLAGQMSANSSLVNAEASAMDRFEATRVMLTVQEEELEAAKRDVAVKRRAAARNLEEKRRLEAEAEAAEAQVAAMVDLRAQARANALEAKNADLAELQKLQAERQRIEQLILQQASFGAGYVGPRRGNGFLSSPVNGSVTSPFGWRTHPIWGYRSLHDGIDYGAACGTPIHATAPGRVVSIYTHSAYGKRLIIDHGVRHGVGVATISNHLSSYAVGVGDRVRRGQIVGFVGNTGWSTGCHLHFTVLQNGTPVNPVNWL